MGKEKQNKTKNPKLTHDILRMCFVTKGRLCEEKVGDKKSQVKWDQNVVLLFCG